jgi:purine-nucleoside phosphorylase
MSAGRTRPHMTNRGSVSERLARACASVRAHCPSAPSVGLVLGSGLGDFAETLAESSRIEYGRIEGMPSSAVAGHAGRLVIGKHAELTVAAMQGRVHLYEGHTPEAVALGVRVMIALGARTIVLTNAAGGIATGLEPGTLMLIEDHLNLTGSNVLVGPSDDALGPRFPQLSDAYDPELRALATAVAERKGIALGRGVYAGLLGPSYETPAEIRMLRTLGADAVGMSTVLETIAARHMGARCLGISCITNRAAGLSAIPPSHAEVQAAASAARERFVALLSGVLDALALQNRASSRPE